jgi:predicted alpha/beta-hydrolase family hydrolase
MEQLEIETPQGPARAHLDPDAEPAGTLVLGHGAGGGVEAVDIATAAAVAREASFTVVLVEQPYRVAGRRAPAPPRQLDAAWTAVVEHLVAGELAGLPLIVGGRSLGARVACRTAAATGASAVLCLSFPVHPPGRPEKSRLEELDAVTLPTLVIQGESDPFGMPSPGPNREVVQVKGDHGLKADLDAVAVAAQGWLSGIVR